jgi:catechol 2,3-dioxygenase-like lactoylglutathione lyase family enzyme
MLDHVTLNVADVEAAKAFYAQALAPLGYELTMDFVEGAGFAAQGKPDFFLAQRGEPSSPVHVAFRSPDRKSVDAFHEAALAAGATDNGPPGIRRVCRRRRRQQHRSRYARARVTARPKGRAQRLGFSRSRSNLVMLRETTIAAP